MRHDFGTLDRDAMGWREALGLGVLVLSVGAVIGAAVAWIVG